MFDVKKTLAKILNWIRDPLVVETHPLQQSCRANYGTTFSIPCSKPGYYPIAIVGYQIAGSSSGYADTRQYRLQNQSSGSGTAIFYVWNNHSANQTWTVTAHVLWKKEG